MFTKTTRDIKVTASPHFLPEHSEPVDGHYVWAYTIQLENFSEQPVQLLNRHWVITDASGLRQEVRGPGVVGEHPVLEPGDSFEYTSGTPLPTPSGFMVGSYQMVDKSGAMFDVAIPAFSLDSPHEARRLN
jgi:ApaG protein